MRFDDLVRSERYFTATLLPALLFHEPPQGVQRFVEFVDGKASTECNGSGERGPKGVPKYDFQDVEVITEFHIARDLQFEGLRINVGSSEEGEPERSAPDVVIVAGLELVVCEGKFFDGLNPKALDEQLRAQRRQVQHLFLNRQLRAYRHVAIVPPFSPMPPIDADAVLTWDDVRELAENLLGSNHYVTLRLRNAVERCDEPNSDPNYDGILSFECMRTKCRELGNRIQVGHAGDLLNMSLVEAEKKRWKWRDPDTNKGNFIRGNWLRGADWLEIVESTRGFGNMRRSARPTSRS